MSNHSTAFAVPRVILLNGLCALAYFLLAHLGFAWGALTANASLLWPPSGWVFFALVVYGNPVLPGLFVGALCSSLWLSFSSQSGITLPNILTASVIAAAGVAQAWWVSLFYKKHFSPSRYADIRTSFRYVATVLVTCTLASTVGNSLLYVTNVMSGIDAIKNWSVWWFGDSLGILVFAPLLLIIHQRKNIEFNSQKIIFLAMSLGVGSTLFAFATVGYMEKQNHIDTHNILFTPSTMQISLLTVGFTLVGLLIAYIKVKQENEALLIAQQQQLEEEVLKQTEALRATNDSLRKEMDERKGMQDLLTLRENHLRTLIDNIPDPIWLKSPDGYYLSINKAVERLFNRTSDEVLGKRAMDFIPSPIANALEEFEQEALRSTHGIKKEMWLHIPFYRQDRLMDMLKIGVRDEQNHTLGVLGIARDVTDNHHLIIELEKFKRFAEFSSQGFAIVDFNAETLYMNRTMRKMLKDRISDDDSKKQFWLYYPEELQARVRDEIFPRVIVQGQWEGELAALHADGSQFPTRETFFVIRDEQGKPQYIGNVMSDISEQKETERELSLAKEAAEEAARAKSRFLANMSHEIRTPLNAVLGYTQLLMRDRQVSGTQRERLQLILTASQRLLGLINDILDLSKIESGALNLRNDYFDLHQEIAELKTIIAERTYAKQLELNVRIEFPAPCVVKGDRQKLGQILLNLLGNAIKFTHQGSVSLMVKRDHDWVEFVISDTGPGIGSQELEQLFSAFRQGQAGEESGGTGLGLALSRHLAEVMNGTLTLSSEIGQGTQATLRLPLPIESMVLPELAAPTQIACISPDSECHVLIVEDDQASCDVLFNLLEQIGCTTFAASNGREGLARCAEQYFDIIFTDIRMPDINGLEMLRQLRANPDYQQTPIIAVSASSLEHERAYYLAQGFQDFIGKPYSFDDIFSALIRHTSAQFETQQTDAGEDSIAEEKIIDLAAIEPVLQHIQLAAASGDMSNCKKRVSELTPDMVGRDRHQQLLSAIKHYDLERVEELVRDWLAITTKQ